MILLIISIVIFTALVAVSFLQVKNKLMILVLCVILLILCNFVNQIRAANQNTSVKLDYNIKEDQQIVQKLVSTPVFGLNNQTVQQKNGDLLQEQRQMINYLFKRSEANQNYLINFQNLHKNRLKIIIQLFSYRTNHTNNKKHVEVYHIDYKQQNCMNKCLRKTIESIANKENFVIFVVENIKQTEQLSSLEQIYMDFHISVIFQTLPRFFQLHSISRLTYRFPFSNNYLPKILEHHPSKTIQYCSTYRSFDYQFYSSSLNTPLLQLCTRSLPTNLASKCVKKYITQEKMKVPENWVRKCLEQQNLEGLIFDNGWVGLKKEYFWSGKTNKTDLVPPQQQI